jgi:hypothetical protein
LIATALESVTITDVTVPTVAGQKPTLERQLRRPGTDERWSCRNSNEPNGGSRMRNVGNTAEGGGSKSFKERVISELEEYAVIAAYL